MFKNRMLWSSLLVTLMIFLAACGNSSTNSPSGSNKGEEAAEKKVELRMMWWGSQARHEATLKVIELFEGKNPNISINAEYLGADGYWDKLNTQIAGGNAPDLIQLGNNYPDYVSRGTLLELDPFMGNEINLSDFDEAIATSGKLNDKQYGINLGSNALGIVYNTELIKKAGMEPPKAGLSWEELEQYSKELVAKLGSGYYAFADQSAFTHYVGHYVRQNGKALFDGSSISFDETDMTSWFDMWKRFRDEGIIPSAEKSAAYLEVAPDNSMLVEGKTAMVVMWSNQLKAFQEAMQDELEMIPLPSGGTEKGMWIQPSQFLGVSAKTEHGKEAAAFINFFVNDPEATAILSSDRGIPGSKVVREALKANAEPIVLKTYNYLDVAAEQSREMDREMPNIAEWDAALKNAAQKIAFGAASAQESAQEALKAAQAAAAKAK
ncbi:ABC transporter substrate-binding protein [Paenibacillus luteus]|uniref:ABC transporter substrate-binding protein n=1 Tax=Paenibacillus luteus TaxID=2545753 RepID=UPI0011412A00|nr:sugar ABC transporter substrate-binding protein [Paenibacillus luteus]